MDASDTTKDPQFASLWRVVLVTGPAGGGRSTALAALEDLGYEPIDNMPLSLLPRLLDGPPVGAPLALGVDSRNRDFGVDRLLEQITALRNDANVQFEMLYLDAASDVLLRRYSETRRRHPMAPAENPGAGIDRELDLLRPVKAQADMLVDTSDMSPHDLRAEVARWFDQSDGKRLAVSIHSFSYKRGTPRVADMVLDCRFLQNPYWDPSLRSMNGLSPEVQAYVSADPRFDDFFARIRGLIEVLLPAYLEEGKSHFSIAFGCTGGQHRSVTLAEKLADALAETGWRVSKRHRELERRGENSATQAVGKASS